MRRRPHDQWTGLLIVPAFLLLTCGFLVPILWFFVEAYADTHGLREAIDTSIAAIMSQQVRSALLTTNLIALQVTLCVLLVGYPLAYCLTQARGVRFSVIIFCVIVPHFTSVVVRTYAWMVLLGRNGLINRMLLALGLTDAPLRLLYTRTGILIGMVYVLLPFMILMLYAAMKAIDPNLLKAAQGLGASNAYVFRRVYFPLSLHAVVSSSLIVFIMSIGSFVMPSLMGGSSDVMIAMLIDHSVQATLQWPQAAAMSFVLLVATLVLYAIYYRVTDLRRLMGG